MHAIDDPTLDLFRSTAQAHLLTWILLEPEREWTLSELAERVDVAVSTVMREVERATSMGVVTSRRAGQTRLVRPTGSALGLQLTGLIRDTLGPHFVITNELEGLDGVHDAFIYGDWALWYSGQPLMQLGDVDVMVVGNPNPELVDSAAERATKRLARSVNATIKSLDWWKRVQDTEGAMKQVRTSVWHNR